MSNVSGSVVAVGAYTDTLPTYTLTLTREAADTITDLTTATAVVLVLPGGTTQAVTKTSATAGTWVGTIRYNAFFTANDTYTCRARVTFPGGVMTVPTDLTFSIS